MPITINGTTGLSGVDGSAGTPALQGSDSNTGIAFGSDVIIGSTGGSERFRVDSSGRLLVGATTSLSVDGFGSNLQLEATTFAASQSIVRHGGTAAIRLGRSGGSSIGSTTIVASGNELGALRFVGADGVDFDSIAGQITCEVDGTPGSNDMPGRLIFSTTADGASSPTERMRIDSSGRLLLGTSTAPTGTNSQYSKHVIQGNTFDGSGSARMAMRVGVGASSLSSGSGIADIYFVDSGAGEYARIGCEADAQAGTNDYPGRLVFSTTEDGASSPSPHAWILNAGRFNVFAGAATDTAFFMTSASSSGTAEIINARHSATGLGGSAGTRAMVVFANGNIQNTNNSYGSLSDIKLKENIVDAGSQWSDLKALQVRKYNFKEETNHQTHTQIGLIAQEVELVSPGLVYETPDRDDDGNDLGTVTKSVNYSVLYMKAVKALQEAMERIESLETRLAALEVTP